MNLLESLTSLVHTYGAHQLVLVGWLVLLALAAGVGLLTARMRGARRSRPPTRHHGAGHQAACWQQFFVERRGHERR